MGRAHDDIRKSGHKVHVGSCNPWRVFDMIKRRKLRTRTNKLLVLVNLFDFARTEYIAFVQDGFDEMLTTGFKNQIYNVYQYLEPELQVCLISTTLPDQITSRGEVEGG